MIIVCLQCGQTQDAFCDMTEMDSLLFFIFKHAPYTQGTVVTANYSRKVENRIADIATDSAYA